MYRAPEAECYICRGTGLDRGHINSIRFHTEEEQASYFIGKSIHHLQGLSQIRFWKGVMRLELVPNRAVPYDYLMFRNIPNGTEVESKWMYAFIDTLEYVNERCVEVTFTMDWIQTYFVLVSKNCPAAWCIRQHSPDDILYHNTQPEPLSTGYIYKQKAVPGWSNFGVEPLVDNDGNFVNWSPVIVIPKTDASVNQLIDGIPNGVEYIWGFNWKWYNDILNEMNEDAKNAVIDIFMFPNYLLNKEPGQEQKRYIQRVKMPGMGFNPWKEQFDWEPKNNKLYSYPYCYISVKGGNQSNMNYYMEHFFPLPENGEAEFHIYGSMSSNPQFICVPVQYNGVINEDEGHKGENFQAAITMRGTPKVPWVTDQYKVYLAQSESQLAMQNVSMQFQDEQNKINLGMSVGGSLLEMLTGVGLYQGAKGIYDAGNSFIANDLQLMAQQAVLNDAKNMSNTVSNYGTNNIFYSCGEYGFRALYTFCDEEYARIADNYFTVFGYAQNKIRRPNFFTRKKFSYFKYAGFALKQDVKIPDAARSQWMEVMKNGVTFWNPDAVIGNYNVDNGVL